MAAKVFVSIDGDVKEAVKGARYPKNALVFSPIERPSGDYQRKKELAYEETSASIEKMMEKLNRRALS
ncbi:hypothetical protein F4V43_18220 [Paenibacillus spiritus]|uniref:Uncharacterized protein n=1 Tax=Paenibacillus spiritus TaxID=2496557 RepID=A0A5J5FUA6_9BACL|nr:MULTISPECIES: hypothetical protein [Paenibacillus]KAA8997226.1 hypothetical protein F4V43_18220 [Paenibacillus spiritus]